MNGRTESASIVTLRSTRVTKELSRTIVVASVAALIRVAAAAAYAFFPLRAISAGSTHAEASNFNYSEETELPEKLQSQRRTRQRREATMRTGGAQTRQFGDETRRTSAQRATDCDWLIRSIRAQQTHPCIGAGMESWVEYFAPVYPEQSCGVDRAQVHCHFEL